MAVKPEQVGAEVAVKTEIVAADATLFKNLFDIDGLEGCATLAANAHCKHCTVTLLGDGEVGQMPQIGVAEVSGVDRGSIDFQICSNCEEVVMAVEFHDNADLKTAMQQAGAVATASQKFVDLCATHDRRVSEWSRKQHSMI